MSHFCFIPCLILGDCNFRNPVLHPCNRAHLHHEQEGFCQSPGDDYTRLPSFGPHRCFWLSPKTSVSWLATWMALTRVQRKTRSCAHKTPFENRHRSRRAAVRLFSSSPWGGVRGIKQTTISKRIYFCSERNELRGTSESTKLTTTVSGLDG